MMSYVEIIKVFGPLAAIALFLVWVLFTIQKKTADKLDLTDNFVRNELVKLTSKSTIHIAESNKIIEVNTATIKKANQTMLNCKNK